MLAFGPMHAWDPVSPLFRGSRFIATAAGVDSTLGITLKWAGPTTGSGSISADIGKMGKVTINGEVPGTVAP